MKLHQTKDGSNTLISTTFDVPYHSWKGAVTESQHVFLEAGLLPFFEKNQDAIQVLEAGFGTGLNALMTLSVAIQHKRAVHFTTLETEPVPRDIWSELGYCQYLDCMELEPCFEKMHRTAWDEATTLGPSFVFEKKQNDIASIQYQQRFDVIYFDAFAPATQPQLWTRETMARYFSALKYGGVLVTYCANGAFKRSLKAVGFRVETLPGPPGKREMVRARKDC